MFVGYTFFEYHPWFVCTQPDRYGRVVIVSATDATKAFDQTCLVQPSDHEAITKLSAIYFDLAQFRTVESFKRRIKNKTIQPRMKASDALMARIRQGALDSRHTPRELVAAIRLCPWTPDLTTENGSA